MGQIVSRTYWNTSKGRIERSLRKSLSSADLGTVDEALVDAALALAKGLDHMFKQHEQQMTLAGADAHDVFGDTKFAYHLRLNVNSYIQALEALLLTPQTRAQYLEDYDEQASPFATELAEVRRIMS